ncbi:MAG: DNA alkylation repair protein [Acutalibacteraceae bacterium]|nr:DNA alkylation repair protein [Acutalibacteraceae bacterium]
MDLQHIEANNYEEFIRFLQSFADEKYKKFHSGIVKNTACDIIGIRLPELRKIAKEILKGSPEQFLNVCGNSYIEEAMLRGLVTAQFKGSFDEVCARVDLFIPYIDNWAVCDTFCNSFKQIKKFETEFFDHMNVYLDSENPWAQRTAFVLMLNYYLKDEYIDRVESFVLSNKSDEYYVQMGKAWLLSEIYLNDSQRVEKMLKNGLLDTKTHNMTIQKCVDSLRVSGSDKKALKALRGVN